MPATSPRASPRSGIDGEAGIRFPLRGDLCLFLESRLSPGTPGAPQPGERLECSYFGQGHEQAQETDAQGNPLASYALSPSGAHLAQKRQGTLSFLGLSPHSDVSFTLDGQGSLSGARVYDPYGNALGGELDCSLSFQEDYQDPASGLAWMGARWYSPELTRFLSVDPLPGELDKPLSQNPYLYCADDPVNSFDPTGKRQVFSDDPSHETHYTMGSINAEAEREEKTPGQVLEEEQERLTRLGFAWEENTARVLKRIMEQMVAVRRALIEAGLKHPLQQGQAMSRFHNYMNSLIYKYGLLEAMGEGDLGKAYRLIIEMGESGNLAEQELRFFLSHTGMNQKMQNEYVNIFHQAEQGWYDAPSGWDMLERGETWTAPFRPGTNIVDLFRSGKVSFHIGYNFLFFGASIDLSNKGLSLKPNVGFGVRGLYGGITIDEHPNSMRRLTQGICGGFIVGGGIDWKFPSPGDLDKYGSEADEGTERTYSLDITQPGLYLKAQEWPLGTWDVFGIFGD